MNQKPPLKACGFLLFQGDPIRRFLLMVHRDRLDLPKGHVDDGEDELQCAQRELTEETGIGADQIQQIDGFRFVTQYPVVSKRTGGERQLKTLVIFLARLLDDPPLMLTEHIGYRWIDWNPPHHIQSRTIDPLLAEVDRFFQQQSGHSDAGQDEHRSGR